MCRCNLKLKSGQHESNVLVHALYTKTFFYVHCSDIFAAHIMISNLLICKFNLNFKIRNCYETS